jgi:hypothetical protein
MLGRRGTHAPSLAAREANPLAEAQVAPSAADADEAAATRGGRTFGALLRGAA